MNFPNQITGTFNKPITLGIGTFKVFKDNVLFLTFTQDDIVVSGSSFSIDVTNLFPNNGSYYVNYSSGLFYNGIEIDTGLFNNTTWTWTIGAGEYDNADYNNDYLIN